MLKAKKRLIPRPQRKKTESLSVRLLPNELALFDRIRRDLKLEPAEFVVYMLQVTRVLYDCHKERKHFYIGDYEKDDLEEIGLAFPKVSSKKPVKKQRKVKK